MEAQKTAVECGERGGTGGGGVAPRLPTERSTAAVAKYPPDYVYKCIRTSPPRTSRKAYSESVCFSFYHTIIISLPTPCVPFVCIKQMVMIVHYDS